MRDITEQLQAYGTAVERWLTDESEGLGPSSATLTPDDTHTVDAAGRLAEQAQPSGRGQGDGQAQPSGRRQGDGQAQPSGRQGDGQADETLVRRQVDEMAARRRRRAWLTGRRATVGAVVAAAAVVLAAVVFWPSSPGHDDLRTQAPAGRPEASSSAPTSAATPSTAPSTSSTDPQTTSTAGTADPAGGAVARRPGPETTGPAEGVALVPVTGEQVEAMMRPGAVIENVAITGGNVDVVADDVTIRNFRLDAAGAPFGFRSCGPDTDCGTADDQRAGFVAEDGEILNTAVAAFRGHDASLRRLDVHDSDAGAFVPLSDVTVEASWWHHLGRGEGSANGVQLRGGRDIEVRGNFCDLPVTVPPPYGSSACMIAGSDADPSLSALVEGNWLDGGNQTVECNGLPGVVVRGNRFGRNHRHDPLSRCPSASANVWDDTGRPL